MLGGRPSFDKGNGVQRLDSFSVAVFFAVLNMSYKDICKTTLLTICSSEVFLVTHEYQAPPKEDAFKFQLCFMGRAGMKATVIFDAATLPVNMFSLRTATAS